jgi:cytochrome c-type biogenesis protein CcmH/NrfF
MEINYWWLSLFFLLIAALVIWLIKRNRKDEKEFEDEIN